MTNWQSLLRWRLGYAQSIEYCRQESQSTDRPDCRYMTVERKSEERGRKTEPGL